MSVHTLTNRLDRADRAAACDGAPTSVIVRRPDRETRLDTGPCVRCGGRHEQTVIVVRDPQFFFRGTA